MPILYIVKTKKSLIISTLILASIPLSLAATKKIIDIRKSAAGTPANIVIDVASNQGTVPSNLWQNLSQGGEEAADMLSPVAIGSTLLQSLHPKLIRIDHLFDYFNVYQGPNNYNFYLLDKSINTIISSGAIPMLSLSYTTADMSENGQNAGAPKDWDQWYQLVKATAKHYSVDKNISGIYYEVWNEPDLFGSWHYGKNPNYSTLYIKTAQAVMDGARGTNYYLGGPATTSYYSNWIKALFKVASQNKLRLDFISWHRYSKNSLDYQKDIDDLNKILIDYPNYYTVQKIITEFGPNPEGDAWYDNSLSGIHLISLSTQLAGKIHKLFSFEIVDGPKRKNDQSTGWGMITHQSQGSLPKPRYFALKFLNQLENSTLLNSVGNGTWVTSLSTRKNKITQTLLVNYDPKNSHVETVPVTWQVLKQGKYRLTVLHYQADGNLRPTSKIINLVNNFRYTETIYMEPNTALILELTPLF